MAQLKTPTPHHARGFVEFVNASPSPFHAVEQSAKRLSAAGFSRLHETDPWHLKRGGKYYLTRNESTIFAFSVGGKFTPGAGGFSIIGAHTDSPCLKVKPRSAITSNGFLQVGVQTYGGGLWHTWFDRDLAVAGRVIVKKKDGIHHQLVNIKRAILNIPNLAIHLDRTVNENGFKPNFENNLKPILATAAKALGAKDEAHHPALLEEVAKEAGCAVHEIADFELCLYDVNPSAIGGLKDEFVFSARIDNLMSSFTSLTALIESATAESIAADPNIRLVSLFDHEEVGSASQQGADSTMMPTVLARILKSVEGADAVKIPDLEAITFRKSFLVSADMAHGLHPNYADKHEANHRPMMHKGPVIKHNANQRYATNAVTAFLIKELAARNGVPMQEFVVRNDSPCGSTIGPILATRCGMRTMDLGCAQFAMHSIRETASVDDVFYAVELFRAFFEGFPALDAELRVD